MTDETALYKYSDLERLGIVSNRTTLKRWRDAGAFPEPITLGKKSLRWRVSDIVEWLEERERMAADAREVCKP